MPGRPPARFFSTSNQCGDGGSSDFDEDDAVLLNVARDCHGYLIADGCGV